MRRTEFSIATELSLIPDLIAARSPLFAQVMRAQLDLAQVRQEIDRRIQEKEEEFENTRWESDCRTHRVPTLLWFFSSSSFFSFFSSL